MLPCLSLLLVALVTGREKSWAGVCGVEVVGEVCRSWRGVAVASGLRKEGLGGGAPTAQGSRNPTGSSQKCEQARPLGSLVPPAEPLSSPSWPCIVPKEEPKPRDAGSS